MKQLCRTLFVVTLSGCLLIACQGRSLGRREGGALAGGAIGAGLGAIVGNQTGSSGAGIAIGSAIGALSGALVGNELDNQHEEINSREDQIAKQEQELEQNRRLIEELKARGADAYGSARGVVVNLPDVLFDFGSADLNSSADSTVREIARAISSVPNRDISIEGHTDSVGTYDYNQRLSESRARSVAQALTRNGVSRQQLKTRGLGESDPISSNSTDVGRTRNRRVEVVIENRVQ